MNKPNGMLSNAERQQILHEWNKTHVEYPEDMCIHELFEAQVERTPQATAAVFSSERVSYDELNRRANRLAHYLRKKGVRPEERIGICAERGVEMVVGLLAVLKAGGAYVPLDPKYPEERLQYMVKDSAPVAVLTKRNTDGLLRRIGNGISVIGLDGDAQRREGAAETNPERISVGLAPGHLAYVIYTSGSTGVPKAVMLEHRNAVNLICWAHQVFSDEVLSRTLFSTSLNFDLAVYECFVPLTRGGSIHVVSNALELAGGGVDVTLINTVPSVMKTLLQERAVPAAVQAVNVAGEPLRRELVESIFAGTEVKQVCNLYGPTETTTYSTWVRMKREDGFLAHIGKPIANTRVYILDKTMDLVPAGVEGEIYIGGAGVARGYLNRNELTAERFVPDPYSAQAGARMYKTGDVGKWQMDGNLEFLGRNDEQVKIRGFRIELGEIAARLQEHPAVAEAVIVARENVPGEKHLVAYYVMDSSCRGSEGYGSREALKAEQVNGWATTYDAICNEWTSVADPSFNTAGWISFYTGHPIPAKDMREWLDRTVERVKALQPKRVWEIGCGTGMLLFRIAPECALYRGTDISVAALNFVRQQLQHPGLHMPQVVLERKAAHEFEDISKQQPFDLLLMNSVVQYFPDLEYLMTVLTGAVETLETGGAIFIGDVRNYSLLEAFHTSVQLYEEADSLSCDALWRRVQKSIQQEGQLVISPDFFTALPQRLPQISRVEINLKRGRAHNELTSFRYDVVLHVGTSVPLLECPWMDWSAENLSLERLREILSGDHPEVLGVAGIPNARVQRDVIASRILRSGNRPATVGELRRQLEGEQQCAVELEDIWSLEKDLPYTIEVRWSKNGAGLCDVLFRRCGDRNSAKAGKVRFPGENVVLGSLHVYSNDPLKPRLAEGLASELRGWLQAKLPEYMVPAVYVRMEQMPLTANGKLDRKALPVPEADAYARQAYEAPQGETEEMLAGIWAELLQVKRVGRRDNFFGLGGHSLQAVRVVTRIQQRLGVAVTVADLFAHPVLADLAGSLEVAKPAELPPIVHVDRGERLPLSFAQQRLFFLAQMEEASKAYHVPWGLHLRGELDAAALRRALDRIVARHEALRTTFVLLDGEPVQRIASAADSRFHLLERDLRRHREAPAELNRLFAEHVNASFNLQTGPLIRGLLVRESEDAHTLLITMHHIVSDGWSLGVFRNELSKLYSAFRRGEEDPLPDLAVQYADYAMWERQWLEGEVLKEQSEYWKGALQGAPAFLELPTDHARPAQQDYIGGIEGLVLEHGLTAGLKELSWRQGTTLYMTLLAGWAVLLARLSGQAEVVIGTSVANRGRAEVEGLIGFFANTLALRVDVSGAISVKELLQRVKKVALGAQQNQNLPFERVVDIVRPERSLTHNPLFQVSLAWQNTPEGAMMLSGVEAKPLEPLPYQPAKFDLTLYMREADGTITGEMEYATALFEPGTVRRYREYFRRLLEGMVAHEWEMVDRLGMLSESEREQVLYRWNETAVEFPTNKTVHELFAEQVEKTPEAVAVEYEGRQLTYGELNRQANRLAHYLQILGVKPEARVAICVERGLEMIVGLMAILKAGGAYVPLDPAYPQERLQYMLEDCEPAALLTQAQVRERLGALPDGLPILDLTDAVWSSQPNSNLEAVGSKLSVGHGHLAYVVYTSGSTGKPKGVMVSHQNLVSSTFSRKVAYGELGRFLLLSSISFDSSVAGIFGSLLHGGTLIIASSDVVRDPLRLNQEVQRLGVESLLCVPSLYKHCLEYSVGSENKTDLSRVIVAGEVCPPDLVAKSARQEPQVELFNEYGPSEATVWASMYRCAHALGRQSVPIGRPIANTRVYILDKWGEPVPIGVAGEVYIGGAGVARGYLNRSELTADRFVPDPYAAQAGARMYKTGDVGRWQADGNLEFLGRNDDQVKIRGFRIELGEIEERLQEHPAVQEAVVIAREDAPGEKRLVAYYSLATPHTFPDHESRSSDLRSFLSGRLPEHMLPAAYVLLESFRV